MKKQLFFALVTLNFVYLASCNKNSVSELEIPNIDSNYLTKYTYTESNNSFSYSVETSFIYDSFKRVTKILVKPDSNYVTKFLYNGSERLPYMMSVDTSGVIESRTFYTYLFNGQLSKDSTISKTFNTSGQLNILIKIIKKYVRSGDKIYEAIRYERLNTLNNNLQIENDFDTTTLDLNDNPILLSQRVRTINCTYGSNPSPMVNVNINPIYSLEDDEAILFQIMGSKNIINTWKHTNINNGVGTITYNKNYTNSYTFTANGYPASIMANAQNGTSLNFKFTYGSLQ